MEMKDIMNMVGQLRTQLADAQSNAADTRFAGESGGGMVKIVINGRNEVIEVKIEPSAVDPNDVSLLEDLVRAAINSASAQLATSVQDRLGSVAQGLGVDVSAFTGGGEEK